MKTALFGKVFEMPLFSAFSKEEFQIVFDALDLVLAKSGDALIKQDERGYSMYLIVEGFTRVVHRQGEERIKLLNVEEGDIIGEMAVFDDGFRSADVDAVVDCVLLKLTKPSLQKLAEAHPYIGFKLLMAIGQIMAQRIQKNNRRYINCLLDAN